MFSSLVMLASSEVISDSCSEVCAIVSVSLSEISCFVLSCSVSSCFSEMGSCTVSSICSSVAFSVLSGFSVNDSDESSVVNSPVYSSSVCSSTASAANVINDTFWTARHMHSNIADILIIGFVFLFSILIKFPSNWNYFSKSAFPYFITICSFEQ